MKYTHITYSERRRIERLLSSKKSKNYIAKILGRSSKTIRYEIKINSVKGDYIASKAEHKSIQKRKNSKVQCMKVATDKELKEYVIKNIKDDQSPECIAGRIKKIDIHIQKVSTKAIYKFIYSPHGRQIEKHLYSKAVKKKGGPKRGSSKVKLDGRLMIDKRPKRVENRLEFGHFEGDFIESGRDGRGSLLVLIERKTRQPFIRYTENKTTKHINNLISETLKDVPLQSLTLDNDLSFQKHKELSQLLESLIFFCHPL
ncbi:IS30 family transposase [Patescibacteria group bacterium]|nr:IS30 family transposase [Patescibacteria group bacterium]